MAYKEYPKMIYVDGNKGVIVNNKEEEDKLVKPQPVKTEPKKPATWGN